MRPLRVPDGNSDCWPEVEPDPFEPDDPEPGDPDVTPPTDDFALATPVLAPAELPEEFLIARIDQTGEHNYFTETCLGSIAGILLQGYTEVGMVAARASHARGARSRQARLVWENGAARGQR